MTAITFIINVSVYHRLIYVFHSPKTHRITSKCNIYYKKGGGIFLTIADYTQIINSKTIQKSQLDK